MKVKRKRLTLDLEPAIQRRLKVIAAIKGISMRQYCIVAIEKALAKDETGNTRALSLGEESVNSPASAGEVPGGRQAPDDSVDEDTEAKVQGQ